VKQSNHFSIDPTTVVDILTLRYTTKLKPTLKKLTWDDFKPNNLAPSLDSIEKMIQDSIKNAIGISRKKVTIALSGGVDSTLVLALLKKTLPELEIEAISIKFADSVDETPRAAQLAEKYQIKHHVVFLENYLAELPKAISIIGLPFWDLHFYHVAKKAQTLSDYLISGDGADELFGGYTFRYSKFLTLIEPNSTPLQKVVAYLNCHERDFVPDQEEIFDKKANFSWKSIHEKLLPYFDNPLPPLEQVFLADYNGKLLYNWSPLFKKIVNHFGIQLVTPIISKQLIEYANHIPAHLKYDKQNNLGKILLRKLLEKYVDKTFIHPTKHGFTVETINLWQSYGKKLCDYYLSESRIVKDGWINSDWITKYINKSDLDVRYINKFFGLLAFEIWYRLFITNELKSDTILN